MYKNSRVPFAKKTHKYDGYTFYTNMIFPDLKNDGDSLGITLVLPNGSGKDATSFGFLRTNDTYAPVSMFTDGNTEKVT